MDTSITIVTGLWDLGRSNLKGWAKRDFEHYRQKFFELLEVDTPMCIWVPDDLISDIKKIRKDKPTHIFKKNVIDFQTWNPFFSKINEIRVSEKWRNYADWLKLSPQGALEYYNAMMFTKMFMLNDSALINPFNSEYFFWLDGGITNTVDKGYFTKDNVLNNLKNYSLKNNNKFLQITYPYIHNEEIHGFPRADMNRYCNTSFVDKISRGGFFGGVKEKVHLMNDLYYSIMEETLTAGLMGADESLFTILNYKYGSLISTYEVGENGLIYPFFEELKNHKKYKSNVAFYVISFNSPKQFETLIESIIEYDPNFIRKTDKFLLDNSTDLTTTPRYKELCEHYGFEHIKKDNLGICGGRQYVSDHFNASDYEISIWSEDDMFFQKKPNEVCKNGFNRYANNLFDICIEIIKKENFDFLKINYTEFYGDNGTQFSWYNVPADVRKELWPHNSELPEHGLSPNPPLTKFDHIKSHRSIPYVTGEIYYSNWTHFITKEGNKKMFQEIKYKYPYENTWMSQIYQDTLKGKIRPGLLLLTPIEHNRFEHYDKLLRREN